MHHWHCDKLIDCVTNQSKPSKPLFSQGRELKFIQLLKGGCASQSWLGIRISGGDFNSADPGVCCAQ